MLFASWINIYTYEREKKKGEIVWGLAWTKRKCAQYYASRNCVLATHIKYIYNIRMLSKEMSNKVDYE